MPGLKPYACKVIVASVSRIAYAFSVSRIAYA